MNPIIKNSFIASSLVLALAFSACTEEAEYDSARPVSGDCIKASFVADNAEYILPAGEGASNSFSVVVARENAEEEATVRLMPTNLNADCFQIPESVTFPAGESTASFTIDLLADGIEEEEFYTYSVALEESAIDPYDENTLAVTTGYVLKHAQWSTSLGTGVYADNALPQLIPGFPSTTACEVLQADGKSWYKIAPFGDEVIFKVDENGTVRVRQQCLISGVVLDKSIGEESIYISTDSTYDGLYNYYDAETNSIVVVLSYVAEATGTLGTLVAELYLP